MVGVTAKGEEFYFDKEDLELVKSIIWHKHKSGYILHKDIHATMMHRLIMNPPSDMDVDHRDGNRANNRRNNLRICTRQQNLWNTVKHTDSKNKYKGITTELRTGRFIARINHNGKQIYLGTFNTEEEAALAYNAKAYELRGEYARLNKVS
jgi:hypothetical protein